MAERDGVYAWVDTERTSGCSSCSAKGCGTGTLSKALGARSHRVRVRNPIDAQVGEGVVLGLRDDALVRGSFFVYIVPLLALLAGALLGETLAGRLGVAWADAFVALAGAVGLALGLLWLRSFGRRWADDEGHQPVILRRIGGTEVRISFP